ncbi:transporter [Thalassotalea mangrovi]|uniref:Transporter n=1 Tax=Thalassotalea mangrovi TaxID=2572245 RepID=A0A4U1B729_9GAMM|nr:transporter [Thalassotalea mangrovi]TKB46384.1 transporter [Thalassotalea mangrovi]
MSTSKLKLGLITLSLAVPVLVHASPENEELAKKLSNPVASLISVPFQFNYDHNIGGRDDGDRYLTNIQPVIPISLNDDWNLISRTILPVVSQDDIFPGAGSQFGIGDVVQSFFFSPVRPTKSGWILGAGPVFLLPTGSDDLLTADKWGAGPTAVALRQDGQWTYGGLFNHIWSFAGEDDRADVNTTFMQPFISYTTKSAITYSLNSETTYNWEIKDWAVPVNFQVSKVAQLGGQTVSYGAGLRYHIASSNGGPEGFGVRLIFTLLFPK